MLFAGFADKIHADFLLATDLILHDHGNGAQLFEWRADVPNQVLPRALGASSGQTIDTPYAY